MNEFNMTLLPKYFDLISAGIKIFEVRLNKDEKSKVKPYDEINFRRLPEKEKLIRTKVEQTYNFPTFIKAIESFPKEQLGFKDFSTENILKVYKEIYPNDDEETQFGVIVYKLKLI